MIQVEAVTLGEYGHMSADACMNEQWQQRRLESRLKVRIEKI